MISWWKAILLVPSLLFSTVIAQDWRNDSMAVREILDSNYMSAKKVSDVALGRDGRITLLHLPGCTLYSLPSAIGKLTGLCSLYLKRNKLESLPSQIGNLTKLTVLSLDINLLTALPPEIGNLVNLRTLSLEMNQITRLPSQIGNLTKLTRLRLNSNLLDSLPPEIGNLKLLPVLELHQNALKSLPNEIGNMSSLSWLVLSNNQLTSLPPTIGNLTNLTRFYADMNAIAHLPPEIGNLHNLTSLEVSQNKLTSLPPECGRMKSLERLQVKANQITHWPDSLRQLTPKYLEVNFNRLCALDQKTEFWLDLYSDDTDGGWDKNQVCDKAFFIAPREHYVTLGQPFALRARHHNPWGGTVSHTYLSKPAWLLFTVADSMGGTPTQAGVDTIRMLLTVSDTVRDTLTLRIFVTDPNTIRGVKDGRAKSHPCIQARRTLSGGILLCYHAPCAGPFTLSVHDVHGRQLWERRMGRASLRKGQCLWKNRTSPGQGIYFAGLTQDKSNIVKRFLWLH